MEILKLIGLLSAGIVAIGLLAIAIIFCVFIAYNIPRIRMPRIKFPKWIRITGEWIKTAISYIFIFIIVFILLFSFGAIVFSLFGWQMPFGLSPIFGV
jgi:hypothetical protein